MQIGVWHLAHALLLLHGGIHYRLVRYFGSFLSASVVSCRFMSSVSSSSSDGCIVIVGISSRILRYAC